MFATDFSLQANYRGILPLKKTQKWTGPMGNKLFEDAFLRAQMSHMSGFNNLCMKFAIQSTHVEYFWQFYRMFAS